VLYPTGLLLYVRRFNPAAGAPAFMAELHRVISRTLPAAGSVVPPRWIDIARKLQNGGSCVHLCEAGREWGTERSIEYEADWGGRLSGDVAVWEDQWRGVTDVVGRLQGY
jgi:hypothetical protein